MIHKCCVIKIKFFFHTYLSLTDSIGIEKFPDAIPRGVFKKVALPWDAKPSFIIFDLKTTDLSKILINI